MATLTTVLGANRTLEEAVPSEKLDVTMSYGSLRVLYDSYTIGASDEFGTSGLIRLFDIPKGARVLEFEVTVPDDETSGIFDIGWAASAEVDSDDVAVEAADADGFFVGATSVDSGAGAIERVKLPSTRPGYMKLFAASCEVQADCTEATNASAGDVLEFMAIIAVD